MILTADAGFGHRRSAAAICQALEELYGESNRNQTDASNSRGAICQAAVVNPLDDPGVLAALRGTQADHDQFARNLRNIYGRIWHASRAKAPSAVIGAALGILLRPVFRELLTQHRPDVIVSTYPLYHTALATAFAAERCQTPVVTVVNDFGLVHRLWFHPLIWACLVATESVRQQAIAFGLPPQKVHLCSIPIDPAFAKEKRAVTALRLELGWCTDLTTVLAVGSRRVPHLAESLSVLNRSGLPIQLAVVAGGDDVLFRDLQKIEWQLPVRVYNWVERMPMLLRAADCVLSKAGGLIIAESLACGLPMVLMDVMPDQETGNVDFVLQNGVGELALSPDELVEILSRWLADGAGLLQQRARCARRLGNPEAAYQAAEFIWRLAETE